MKVLFYNGVEIGTTYETNLTDAIDDLYFDIQNFVIEYGLTEINYNDFYIL